jgi:hypothetical protein
LRIDNYDILIGIMKKLVLIAAAIGIGLSAICSDGNIMTENESMSTVNALTYTVKGKVIDKATGESLAGVALSVDGSDKVYYTDFEGTFVISNISKGEHNLSASMISYKERSLSFSNKNEITVEIEPINK